MRRLFSIVTLAAATTLAASAAAQSESDINLARNLGMQAQDAEGKQDWKKAEDLYSRAHNLYPAATTLTLGLARSQAKQGKWVEAAESYNQCIRAQLPANPPPAFTTAIDTCKAEIGPARQKIANVTITVKDASGADVQHPTVTVDGQPVNEAALGVPYPVDPGQHTIHASKDGYDAADKQFTVGEGATTDGAVVLQQSGGAATPPPGTTTPPPGTTTPGTTEQPGTTTPGTTTTTGVDTGTMTHPRSKVPMYVAFGVGGAGLVAGLVTGFLAMSKHSDLADKCPDGHCPADLQSDIDSYHTMGLISTIGFGVGVVGIGAGVYLLLTQPKNPPPTAAFVQPYVGPGSAGLYGRF